MTNNLKNLGDVCENISRSYDFTNRNKVIFINTGDVLNGKILHNNYSKFEDLPGQAKKAIKKNDILFSEIRPINKRFAFINDNKNEHVVSTKFMVLQPKKEVNPKYLYYFITSEDFTKLLQREAESRSGTFPQITFDSIFYLPINIPLKIEQDKISNFIDLIDEKIDVNKKINETLQQISETLFKSWFINFDPVIDKENNIKSELNKKTSDLFPKSFENCEIGKIPKGWKLSKISDLCLSIKKGISPNYTDDKTYPVINQKCVRNLEINFDLCKFTRFKNSMEQRFLQEYDILVNSMGEGTLGRVGLYVEYNTKVVVDGCISVLRGQNKSTSLYIFQNLVNREKEIINLSLGTTGQTTLKTNDLGDLKIIEPPKDLVEIYYNIVKEFYYKKTKNNLENKLLNKIRNYLLKKLFLGEIKL